MKIITHKEILDWLMPILLAGAVDMLFEIKKELAGINISLAVANTRLDADERRIGQLEATQHGPDDFRPKAPRR